MNGMSEDIKVTDVEELEDGGANYTFEMGTKAAVWMAQVGLEVQMYCMSYNVDFQNVLDWISSHGEEEKETKTHDNLTERLRNWRHVYEEDHDKPDGSLYIEAADRIEELEQRIKELIEDKIELTAANISMKAKLANIENIMVSRIKFANECKQRAGSESSKRRERYRSHALSEALGEIRKEIKEEK